MVSSKSGERKLCSPGRGSSGKKTWNCWEGRQGPQGSHQPLHLRCSESSCHEVEIGWNWRFFAFCHGLNAFIIFYPFETSKWKNSGFIWLLFQYRPRQIWHCDLEEYVSSFLCSLPCLFYHLASIVDGLQLDFLGLYAKNASKPTRFLWTLLGPCSPTPPWRGKISRGGPLPCMESCHPPRWTPYTAVFAKSWWKGLDINSIRFNLRIDYHINIMLHNPVFIMNKSNDKMKGAISDAPGCQLLPERPRPRLWR